MPAPPARLPVSTLDGDLDCKDLAYGMAVFEDPVALVLLLEALPSLRDRIDAASDKLRALASSFRVPNPRG